MNAVALAAPPAQPASAARIRVIGVHLTPLAPGCAGLAISDRRRWKEYWSKTPVEVLRGVLARLRLAPGQVKAQIQANGDIALLGPGPAGVLIEGDEVDAEPPPLAYLFEAITLAEVAAALAQLRKDGWTPSTLGALQ